MSLGGKEKKKVRYQKMPDQFLRPVFFIKYLVEKEKIPSKSFKTKLIQTFTGDRTKKKIIKISMLWFV